MRFGAYHTYIKARDRKLRKKLGFWDADFAKAVWVTKGGKEIKVRDMGHQHLTNTIKLLYRKAAQKKHQNDAIFLEGPFPQGEMATLAFEEACDDVFGMDTLDYVQDIFHDMMEEATIRGFDMEEFDIYFKSVEDYRFSLGLRLMQRARDLS